ncbi:TlpA disulfide reductase family protein [uncultured Kordia sp.]|uniref:TlpA family protein disulfide reductase n=1 Tax=uncultured Kordia sp. TaxID=507699 RepID=UPI0026373BAF|nr:TlpA disulfide reductase family protein [uncultured Kordia sp.]
MKKTVSFCLLCLILFSCNSDSKTKKETTVKFVENVEKPIVNTNPVTFIVSNEMKNEYVSIYRNISFDTFSTEKHVYTKKANDTLQLDVNVGEKLFITSKFTAKDTLLVKNGDTIFLNLKDKKITITHKNAANIKSFKLKNAIIDSLTSPFYIIDYNAPFELQSDKYQKLNPIYPLRIHRENFKTKTADLEQLTNVLVDNYIMISNKYDSLSAKELSKVSYYKILKDELNQATFFELNRFYSYSKNKNIKELISSNLFFNKETIDQSTLYVKLNTFITKIVLDGKRIREKFKLKLDYKTAYDSVSSYIKDKKLLPLAKIVCINGDASQGASKEELITYIQQFKNEFPDNSYDDYLNSIEETYGLSKRFNIKDTDAIHLVDIKEKAYQFDEFLKKNKGKLVYVDIWASWCAPCRAAMPDSKKLAEIYKEKDIVFTYLSIDRNKSHWKKAAETEGIKNHPASFLATNYPKATFYKELKVKTIPRYLLFDKNGKLVHENAPGPDSDEIRNLLDTYITK